jgi:hypothetical protein
MGARFDVLLVDDGELADVRQILEGMGLDLAHLRGGAVPDRLEPPRDLFVATARRAPLARSWAPDARPVRIAVVEEDSNALRAHLRGMGFSYLVRRPFHPEALRLLMLRALYGGHERRSGPRVAVGYEVTVRSGLGHSDALLVDLSTGGCRALLARELAEGSRVRVRLPSGSWGDRALELSGRVLWCRRESGWESDGTFSAAIAFEALAPQARALLESELGALYLGDWQGGAIDPGERQSSVGGSAREATALEDDRRLSSRGGFREEVGATVGGALHRVLIGRDLSAQGMRVESHPDLAVGARLRLALFEAGCEAPLVLDAVVIRDDGDRGLALRFADVPAELVERLEVLVAGLPPVECLEAGELDSLGTVVSELVRP